MRELIRGISNKCLCLHLYLTLSRHLHHNLLHSTNLILVLLVIHRRCVTIILLYTYFIIFLFIIAILILSHMINRIVWWYPNLCIWLWLHLHLVTLIMIMKWGSWYLRLEGSVQQISTLKKNWVFICIF